MVVGISKSGVVFPPLELRIDSTLTKGKHHSYCTIKHTLNIEKCPLSPDNPGFLRKMLMFKSCFLSYRHNINSYFYKKKRINWLIILALALRELQGNDIWFWMATYISFGGWADAVLLVTEVNISKCQGDPAGGRSSVIQSFVYSTVYLKSSWLKMSFNRLASTEILISTIIGLSDWGSFIKDIFHLGRRWTPLCHLDRKR